MQTDVYLKVTGSSFSFFKCNINSASKSKNDEYNIDDFDYKSDDEEISDNQRYRNYKRRLIKLEASIKNKPNYFITLVRDPTLRDDIIPFEILRKNVNNFIRKIHYKYEDSWFLPIIEYGDINKEHFHIFANIDNKCPFDQFKIDIKYMWRDTSDYRRRDSFDIKVFDEIKFSYCIKKNKLRNYKAIRQRMPNCHLYGLKYKKNIEFYDPITYFLTEEEFEELLYLIKIYYDENHKGAVKYIEQMNQLCGMISFVPYDKLNAMIKEIMSKR